MLGPSKTGAEAAGAASPAAPRGSPAAPAPPHPRPGRPPLPFLGTGAPGEVPPGQSVRVSLRGPGGRLAGRPGLEGEGTGEGAWRQAAEALQQSSGPCHFASVGTRRRAGDARPAAPPSRRRSRAGGVGRPPASWSRGPFTCPHRAPHPGRPRAAVPSRAPQSGRVTLRQLSPELILPIASPRVPAPAWGGGAKAGGCVLLWQSRARGAGHR